jgi:hypothetical protein
MVEKRNFPGNDNLASKLPISIGIKLVNIHDMQFLSDKILFGNQLYISTTEDLTLATRQHYFGDQNSL